MTDPLPRASTMRDGAVTAEDGQSHQIDQHRRSAGGFLQCLNIRNYLRHEFRSSIYQTPIPIREDRLDFVVACLSQLVSHRFAGPALSSV